MLLDSEIRAWLKQKYEDRPHMLGNFGSLCDQVEKVRPDLRVKRQKRYVGFYNQNGDLFAYADFQREGVKIGVFESDLRRVKNISLKTTSFPEWSNRCQNAKLVGIGLDRQVETVAQILAELYDYAGAD